jgi:hypothetical protein
LLTAAAVINETMATEPTERVRLLPKTGVGDQRQDAGIATDLRQTGQQSIGQALRNQHDRDGDASYEIAGKV